MTIVGLRQILTDLEMKNVSEQRSSMHASRTHCTYICVGKTACKISAIIILFSILNRQCNRSDKNDYFTCKFHWILFQVGVLRVDILTCGLKIN